MDKTVLYTATLMALAAGCGSDAPTDQSASTGELALAANTQGRGGTMPAYYDDTLFTINFAELPPGGEAATLAHNMSINTIYQCDQCEAAGFMFVSVLDAIQGDGFNPLWNEVQITFAAGVPFTQFTSDNDVLAAAAAGKITLTPTTEVYRCAVIGPNK
jgi:hypothetical protein